MKMVAYEYEQMLDAGKLLNKLNISGIDNFRMISEIANVLDSGIIFEEPEKETEVKDSGVSKALQRN